MREHLKGRKSVGSRPAASEAAGTVAGSLRASGAGICRWKALRIGEAALVDARAVKAVLALCGRLATGKRGARHGASEVGSPTLRAAENAARGRLCLRAELVSFSKRRDVGRLGRSWRAPSSAAPPGVGLPQGGLAPQSGWHWAHAWCASRRRSSRRELRAQESSE